MNIYEKRAEILKELIGDATTRDFAERYNLNQSYISQILNNKRSMGDKSAISFEDKLGLPKGTLSSPQLCETDAACFEQAPEITRWKRAQIVGTAQMGSNGYWSALESSDGFVEVISTDPGSYALRVKGESMSPTIRNGWVVWCEPNHELVSGEYVMVKKTNGECMVKELLYANSIEVSLMSVNPDYERLTIPLEDIEQIHYVGGITPPSKVKY